MFKFNIIKWCDDKITCLKNEGIPFEKGVPQFPKELTYTGDIKALSPFSYQKDIPEHVRKESLICYYMYEEKLWPRLQNIDDELSILKKYGGIVGFDLSPCVEMLRPRQRLSILINSIFSCFCGINGVKVLPNYRPGDLGTLCAADYFPDNVPFMVGNLGCSRNGFKEYGEYELEIALRTKRPPILYIYGGISKYVATRFLTRYVQEIISFPDRRNRIRNGYKSYRYYLKDGKTIKEINPDMTLSKGGIY